MLGGIGMGMWSNVAALGGGAAFTPASLSPDFWVEARDTAHIFTDLGVTPVTADGQAVEQWNDKSGSGRNLTQSVAGERPLYKTDLAKPSILFDGVDDLILTTGDVAWADGSGQQWFALSMQSSNVTSNIEIATVKSSGAVYNSDLYTGGSAAHLENLTSSTFEEDVTAATLAANTPVVLIGTITTAQIEVWVDNSSNGAHTNVGTPSTVAGSMRFSGGGTAWPGRIFGFVHGKGTLSSGDRASLQTYMAALHP